MKKIQSVSQFFYYFFIVVFAFWCLAYIAFWINVPNHLNLDHIIKLSFVPDVKIMHPLTLSSRFIGFLIGLIPVAIDLYVIYCLARLFSLYKVGKIFTLENIQYIKRIAYFLLLGQIINPFYQVVMSGFLTYANPHGHRVMVASVSGMNISIIIISVITIVIAWIMKEAQQLKLEQEYTV